MFCSLRGYFRYTVITMSSANRHAKRKCSTVETNVLLGVKVVLDSGHPEMRTHLAVPNTPLKSGHLTNRDTFFCPKCVQIREVPLNIIINCCVSIFAVSIDADDPENEVGTCTCILTFI